MAESVEHEHILPDGKKLVHSHPHGDEHHHHREPQEGEHAHELPDGTKIVHQHDAADPDHQH